MTEHWTLDELVGRAADALATGDVRAPNGRVTQLPDARVIRWYATIGLVDRPIAMRGRTALYGPRHLLQLVAVKRLQAQGRSLAEIQAELAGATDATLRRVAALPAQQLPAQQLPAQQRPAQPQPAQAERAQPLDQADTVIRLPKSPARSGHRPLADRPTARRFWTEPAAPAEHADRGKQDSGGDRDSVALLHGVRLAGATLLLPARPDDDDLVAIRAAARPLLDLLAERDLLTPKGTPS